MSHLCIGRLFERVLVFDGAREILFESSEIVTPIFTGACTPPRRIRLKARVNRADQTTEDDAKLNFFFSFGTSGFPPIRCL